MFGYTKATPKELLKKWIVFYRTHSGGFGEVGWITFNTREEAEKWGETFKAENSYVSEIIVRHPSKIYSSY